jgi:hypothetical protein
MGMRNEHNILVGTPEGTKQLRRPKSTLEDNIKVDLKVIKVGGCRWIHLAQDSNWWMAFLNTVIKCQL